MPIPCLKPCHFLFVIKCRYSCFPLQKSGRLFEVKSEIRQKHFFCHNYTFCSGRVQWHVPLHIKPIIYGEKKRMLKDDAWHLLSIGEYRVIYLPASALREVYWALHAWEVTFLQTCAFEIENLLLAPLSKLGVCLNYFSYSPYMTLKKGKYKGR